MHELRRASFALVAGLVSLAFATSAASQSFMPMGSFEAVAYPVAITPLPLKIAGSKGFRLPAPPASSGAQAVQTSYRASPAVTDRVKRQFAQFVGRYGGDEAGLAQAMDRDDFFARWGRHVAQYGLRRGDVSDAMAAYWVLSWQIANDVRQVSRGQVLGVKRQVVSSMADDPAFRGLSDAQKQETAEALILNFIIQSVSYEDALKAGDRAMRARLQDAAAARFRKEMDIDLRRLELTENGFSLS